MGGERNPGDKGPPRFSFLSPRGVRGVLSPTGENNGLSVRSEVVPVTIRRVRSELTEPARSFTNYVKFFTLCLVAI